VSARAGGARARGWHAWIACVAGLALAIPTAPVFAAGGLGPAPRDADGRFENRVGPIAHGGFATRFPFFLRRFGTSIVGRGDGAPRVENDGAFLRENARHSVPTLTWVGHATLLVQMGGASFLTDPTWSRTASPVRWPGPRRFVPPGIDLDDLPPIDFVVVSHNHYDHLDAGTLRRLARRDPETRFLVPLGNGELLRKNGIENVDELDWGEGRRVGGVTVHCLPAQHWSRRGLRDERRALWSSWAMIAPERRFYFAGDSGYFEGYTAIGEALGPFDVAAVPIGAYEPQAMMREAHLDPEQAVQAARDLRAQRAMGMHFGTFDLSDEPLDEPPKRFRAAGRAAGLDDADVWILKIGETREF
jgi:N-acyl-phosphatidylethanolamine-hydrolysing phospholipase D